MMFEYRITKYDPKKRDAQSYYLPDEWFMYSQVGREVGGSLLTMEEYLRVENSYINTAVTMLAECGVDSVAICGLENNRGHQARSFVLREGERLIGESLREALRSILREEFWCRLEENERSYIHIGWDYYMYLGVPCRALAGIEAARSLGLFVEPFESPYKQLS
jgi:hypothetical protein